MISAKKINKIYGRNAQSVNVLKNVDFEVSPGSVFTLLGPSGCGKTTTLRCIAGLETPDSGEIQLGNRTVFSSLDRINCGAEQRRLGMVFQSYAIWPHMTVGENVSYPIDGYKLGRTERDSRVKRALSLVGLSHLIDRPAPNLSGGQQQRVALARALVAEPEILLLDEPLSNLDAKLRDQMRREIIRLQRLLNLTTLFVTHDQEEALALSDVIALMNNGEVIEMGNPMQLYDFPKNRFTAGFLGLANFLPASLLEQRVGETVLDVAFGRFEAVSRCAPGRANEFFFRPHKVTLVGSDQANKVNVGTGRVAEAVFLGEINDVLVEKDGQKVRLRISSAQRPQVGDEINFAVDPAFSLAFEQVAK